MNALSPEIIERLGWVLIHSLWQFAAVALISASVARVLRQSSATARYAVLVFGMAVMVASPCVTWILIPASGWAPALRENAVVTDSQPSIASEEKSIRHVKSGPTGSKISMNVTAFEAPAVVHLKVEEQTRRADAQPLSEKSIAMALTEILRPWFSWIVVGWVIGVLVCSLRPLLGWRMLLRLRYIGIHPPSDEVLAAFQRVSQRLGLRRAVQVCYSTLAQGPVVVGYLRPVVLLPVSLATSIPLAQLESIFAHELAHIRRHDFVINLAQTMVETLFFYHPGVWWLSRQIRIEREHCCDDLVVKLFNNRIEYGRALLAIEQLQDKRTFLALGAADGSLLARIRRIAGTTSPEPRVFPFLATFIAATMMCGIWMAGQELIFGAASDESKEADASVAEMSADLNEVEMNTPEVLTLRQNETCIVEPGFSVGMTNGFSSNVYSMQLTGNIKQYQIEGKSVGFDVLCFSGELHDESPVPVQEFLIPVHVIAADSHPSRAVRKYQVTSANRVPGPKQISEQQSKLTILAGVATELEFPWLIGNIQASEEGIVRAQVVHSKHRLSVLGVSPGRTTLQVMDARLTDRQEFEVDLEILPVTRANVLSLFSANMVKSASNPAEPIQARLPKDGLIQLLGVSTTTIDPTVSEKRDWWLADGTVLAKPPVETRLLELNEKRNDGRKFVFQLSGRGVMHVPNLKVSFLKHGQPIPLPTGQEPWSQAELTWNREMQNWILEIAVGPVGTADSVELELRLNAGMPGTKTRHDRYGQSRGTDFDFYNARLMDMTTNRLFRRVQFLRSGPHKGGFGVWTRPFSSDSEDGCVTLGLRDSKAVYQTSQSQSDGAEQVFVFRSRPEDVEEFYFEFHPYNALVKTRNVALEAGQKTEPEMTMEPIVQERIQEQVARDTLSEMYADSIEFVRATDVVEDLHLRNLPMSGWQFVSLLSGIRAIEIRGGDMRFGALRRIAAIPGLKSLSIAEAKCLPQDLSALAKHPTLENLDIALTTEAALADEEERMHIWTHTQFAEREWIESNLKRLSQRFSDEVATRHRLEAAVLTDRSVWSLAELPNLKSLRLVNSAVSGSSVRAFTELTQLQHLNIDVIDPTAETGADIAACRSLLSFGTIEDASDVLSQLSFSETLEDLDITSLTDDGVENLVGMIQLRKLHLSASELSDEGLLRIGRLHQLTELSFEGSKGTITNEGIARLNSLLPTCQVMIEKP